MEKLCRYRADYRWHRSYETVIDNFNYMENKIGDWQVLEHEEIFQKYGRGIERKRFRLPQGNEADFYLYLGHDSVACVALTKDKQVILVKQFRQGPLKEVIELPGGALGTGEKVEEAMERELLEETGYQGKATFVASVLPHGYATYKKNALVILGCEKIAEPILEENGERLEVVLMSLDEFRQHIRTGQMTDVEISYLCLDHLGLL